MEDLITAADPEFWRMIEAGRCEPAISLEDLAARIERTRPGRPRRGTVRASTGARRGKKARTGRR
jgi:hypothetical protein